MKLGFKACQNPRCEEPVYYKHEQCKVCGFVQVRTPKAADAPQSEAPTHTQRAETEATTAADVGSTPTPAASQAPPSPPTQLVPPADPYSPVSYVVMEDFAAQIGDVHVRLKRGRVITDPTLIARLESNNCPIRPTATVDNLACCPQCKHVFTPARLMPDTGRKGAA
jgi:hypothetical protein